MVYDSPHSGRFYPPDFKRKRRATNCGAAKTRTSTSCSTTRRLSASRVLDATYPRCYIDLNRAETDIDAALLSEPWPTALAPTEKSARGLGLLRRYVVPGVEVNAHLLSVSEVRDRIDRVYRPYHAALDRADR